MKEKDLITIYRAFSNLYGAILDTDAFKIIQHYFPDFTLEEFKKDLKKRLRSLDRTFQVKKWIGDNEYVIRGSLNNRETKTLFFLQSDKPFYIPKTFEELASYEYYGNINAHNDEKINEIKELCIKYVGYFDNEFAKTLAFAIAEDTQLYVLQHIHPQDVIAHLKGVNGINFSPRDEETYLKLYHDLRLSTRTKEDRGFTTKEINECYIYDKMFRPILELNKDNFLLGLMPHEVDIDWYNDMINHASTFSSDEKEFIKKQIYNYAKGVNQATA